jgi:hypothetical protein
VLAKKKKKKGQEPRRGLRLKKEGNKEPDRRDAMVSGRGLRAVTLLSAVKG